MAKYISSTLTQTQRTQDPQDRQQQYTIYKEGGPGFTRYIVYTDNQANREDSVNLDNTSVNKEVTRNALRRHKSVPPRARERRKTGVVYVEGNVVMLLSFNSFQLGYPDNKMFYHQMLSITSQEESADKEKLTFTGEESRRSLVKRRGACLRQNHDREEHLRHRL